MRYKYLRITPFVYLRYVSVHLNDPNSVEVEGHFATTLKDTTQRTGSDSRSTILSWNGGRLMQVARSRVCCFQDS